VLSWIGPSTMFGCCEEKRPPPQSSPSIYIGHSNSVTCLAALKGGKVVSGSKDATLRIWGLDGTCEKVLVGHVHTKAYVSTATGSASRNRGVMNPDTGLGVTCCAVLAGGKIASGGHDGTLRIWSADGACERVLQGHGGIQCLAALEGKKKGGLRRQHVADLGSCGGVRCDV
jgi:WD40 repeat protein